MIDGLTIEEWREMPWWPNGRPATTQHSGCAGHDREIVVNIEGYTSGENFGIPDPVVAALRAHLPEAWKVESRSSRVEIHPSGRYHGGYDAMDVAAVERAIYEIGLVIE